MSLWNFAKILAKITTFFVFGCTAVWIFLFTLHVFLPSQLIAQLGEDIDAVQYDYFARADMWLGLQRVPIQQSPNISNENESLRQWVVDCLGTSEPSFEAYAAESPRSTELATAANSSRAVNEVGDPIARDEVNLSAGTANDNSFPPPPANSLVYDPVFGVLQNTNEGYWQLYKNDDPTLERLSTSVANLQQSISSELFKSRIKLDELKNTASNFSILLICLGALTTVVSAINSIKITADGTKTSNAIRVTAVVLPALVTAFTAASTIYASTDQINRKAQMVSSLMNLGSEIGSTISTSDCPLMVDAADPLEQSVGDWRRRLATIVVTAEVLPSERTDGGKDGNSGRKDALPPK